MPSNVEYPRAQATNSLLTCNYTLIYGISFSKQFILLSAKVLHVFSLSNFIGSLTMEYLPIYEHTQPLLICRSRSVRKIHVFKNTWQVEQSPNKPKPKVINCFPSVLKVPVPTATKTSPPLTVDITKANSLGSLSPKSPNKSLLSYKTEIVGGVVHRKAVEVRN